MTPTGSTHRNRSPFIGPKTSDRLGTTSSVRQGCVLAPALFCRAIDWILEHIKDLRGIQVGDHTITNLDYADDIVLPVHTFGEFLSALDGFSVSSGSMGLIVLLPKTKVQSMGTDCQLTDVLVAGQKVEAVESFCYLGSTQSSSGRCRPGMLRRLGGWE